MKAALLHFVKKNSHMIKKAEKTYMTSIYGMNNLKIRSAVIRNGYHEKKKEE